MHHYQTEYDQYESESRVANIREFFNSIEEFTEYRQKNNQDDSLAAFLEEVSLMTDIDNWNSNSNAITLMTLHAAKGLEFPVVFITGLEMGLLPLQRNSANIDELEEERRLLYVGMTRAQEKLYLSYAQSRRKNNQYLQTMPSLFMDELPQDLVDFSSESIIQPASQMVRRKRRKKKINSYIEQDSDNQSIDDLFKVGQKVYHATFGKGKIRNLEGQGDKMKITVDFTDEGITKKLMKEYANLTPLEE
jgi:DNA helicase-2/ATP-dependent DNA helicase PcrA